MFDRSKGRCLHCKQSLTKSKSYGCSITPEGSEEHLLRLYQDSGGREPNDRRRRCDGYGGLLGYYLYYYYGSHRSWGREEGVIEGDPRIPELSKGPIKGPLTCIPGFFKWPWPQVVEKAPNWGFLGPQSRSINNSNVKKENG